MGFGSIVVLVLFVFVAVTIFKGFVLSLKVTNGLYNV